MIKYTIRFTNPKYNMDVIDYLYIDNDASPESIEDNIFEMADDLAEEYANFPEDPSEYCGTTNYEILSKEEDIDNEALGLPDSVVIPYDYMDPEIDDIEESINNYLSDAYGFCVKTYNYEQYIDYVIVNDIEWDTED